MNKAEKKRILEIIDNKVNAILSQGESDQVLLIKMVEHLPHIQDIIKSSTVDELNSYCLRYQGFYQYIQVLEFITNEIAQIDEDEIDLMQEDSFSYEDFSDDLDDVISEVTGVIDEVQHGDFLENPTIEKKAIYQKSIQSIKDNITLFLAMKSVVKDAGDLDNELESKIKQALEVSNEAIALMTNLLNKVAHAKTEQDRENIPFEDSDEKYSINEALVKRYESLRSILREVSPQFITSYTREGFDVTGKRLKVSSGNSLFLENSHEMNVFLDLLLFFYRPRGKAVIQEFYDNRKAEFAIKTQTLLKSFTEARFSILEIVKPFGKSGLIVYDPLTQKEHLLIDNGFAHIARLPARYSIVTQYFFEPEAEFIMTTGASIPLPHTHLATSGILSIFEKLKNGHNLPRSEYLQAVYDIYGTCIHSDITKLVLAEAAPFGGVEPPEMKIMH